MHDETLDTSHIETDANGPEQSMRDVVTGPIGSARLVDPAKAEAHGIADLDAPPTIETDKGSTD